MDFQCPSCHHGRLVDVKGGSSLRCDNAKCYLIYPIVDGRPVLLCEERSLFQFSDFLDRKGVTTMDLRPEDTTSVKGKISAILKRLAPEKSRSVCDYEVQDFIRDLAEQHTNPTILVVGAGEAPYEVRSGINIIYSDVALGPLTNVIADAHDLPFPDQQFDAVVAVAVLEHVLSPNQVVSEITRVLKHNGYVYSNTPFMQQVHMGAFDFTRFTALGHRYLWRDYDETRSGVSNGPGMVVSWAIEYFIRTILPSSRMETLACYMARIVTFPFRWADKHLINCRGAYDAASAYYFVGRKREAPVSNAEILRAYRGKQ